MKTFVTSALPLSAHLPAALAAALGLAAAFPAWAQSNPDSRPPPQDGQGGHQGGPGGRVGYGGNDVAAMSLQQFQARQVANVMRRDVNHEGRVSLTEWTAWRDAHRGRGGAGDPARAFERYDLNHDGYVTPDEVAAVAARRYARAQGRGPGAGIGRDGPGQGGPDPSPQLLQPQ